MDIYQLEAVTGRTDHLFELMAAQIAESPEYQEVVANAIDSGLGVPEELADALESNYGIVYDATSGMFEQIQPDPELVESIRTQLDDAGVQVSDGIINALALKAPDVQANAINLLTQIQSGATLTAPQMQSLMSALGYSVGDDLAASIASKSPDVQFQAIGLLNQLPTAAGSQRETILSQLSGLGIEFGDSLSQGIGNSSGSINTSTAEMIDSMGTAAEQRISYISSGFDAAMKELGAGGVAAMEDTVSSSKISAPGMTSPDWTDEARSGRSGMQSYLNDHPLSVTVNVKQGSVESIRGYAYGGIATEPSIFGEDGPEMAIPLSQEKRTRALVLYQQTGEILGVTKQESAIRQEIMDNFAASYRIENGYDGRDIVLNAPDIDYDLLAGKVADRMGAVFRRAPIQPVIEMKDGDVYLDNERVGRKQAPVISRIMAQDT